jgi:hypothetical protein
MTLNKILPLLIICLLLPMSGKAESACARKELKAVAEAYMAALEARNPEKPALAENARFTENGKELNIGEGLWQTAGKILLKRTVIDAEQCGTHTQAVIEESGRPIIFGARLKLTEAGRITEIETYVAREKEFAFSAAGLLKTKNQKWERVIPSKQRTPREAMIRAADDYFLMFSEEPKVEVSFTRPCDRWENGTLTTVKTSTVSVIESAPEHDCSPKGLITPRHGVRRFMVDEEAGVVVAYVRFSSLLPDFHMFRMRNGKIDLIQAVIGANAGPYNWTE